MACSDVRYFSNGRHEPNVDENFLSLFDQATSESTEVSIEAVVGSQPLVVISVDDCPKCQQLSVFLALRGVPSSVFVKWDKGSAEYPALKEALSQHAGEVFSYPQVFSNGTYEGGFMEVVEKLEAGAYDELFEQEFDAEPKTMQKWIQKQPMVVFSLPNCPQCDELYGELERCGLPAKDLFIKLDKAWPQYQCLKRQLIKLIKKEQFTFPQTFVRGEYQGSFDEVVAKVRQGEFASFFSEAYGVKMIEAPVVQELPAAGAISFDEDF